MSDMINKNKTETHKEQFITGREDRAFKTQTDRAFLMQNEMSHEAVKPANISLFISDEFLSENVNLPAIDQIPVNEEQKTVLINRKSYDPFRAHEGKVFLK